MRRRHIPSLLAFAATLGLSAASHAGVIFTLGNNPEANEENILFTGSPAAGAMLTGTSDQSQITVNFSSTQTLYLQGNGQSMILGSDQHPDRTDVTNLTITTPNYSFRDFIANMVNGHGTATLTATTLSSGSFTFDMTLGNGENFFTVVADGGDTLSSIKIDADGFLQFKQPRISGPLQPETPPPAGVPEPASLALLGLGLLALRRRARS